MTRTVEHPAKSRIVSHPAVAHQEFRYQRLLPAHTEYYWSVYERTNTQAALGVEDPTDPVDPADPVDPTDPTDPADPPGRSEPITRNASSGTGSRHAAIAASGASMSSQPTKAGAHSPAVPVSIDAGL